MSSIYIFDELSTSDQSGVINAFGWTEECGKILYGATAGLPFFGSDRHQGILITEMFIFTKDGLKAPTIRHPMHEAKTISFTDDSLILNGNKIFSYISSDGGRRYEFFQKFNVILYLLADNAKRKNEVN